MPDANRVVLVVDDESEIRELLARLLNAAGFRVVEADSALAACRVLQQERIDAVVLDMRMLSLSGLEVLQWIRSEPALMAQTISVFILTGYAPDAREQEIIQRHRAQVFFKPHGYKQVIQAIGLASRAGSEAE